MEDVTPDPAPTPRPAPPDELVRRLGARYVMVLAAVAGLILADQAIIQPLLIRHSAYAPAINIAGRQRMLSQRLAKAALAMQTADDESVRESRRTEVRESLRQWSKAHEQLRDGTLNTRGPSTESAALAGAWLDLEPHFDAMTAAAHRLVSVPADRHDAAAASAVAEIVDHESHFLATMDRIVKLLEDQATAELRQMRMYAFAIAAMIVALVVALGAFVIRPATRTIRRQVDDLESQVAARTGELDAALESLRHEIDERQRMEARSQVLAAELAHADRVESMGRLAAGLAHELNQPLGAIANYAATCAVVLAKPLDEHQRGRLKEFTAAIQAASLRAGGIVRRLRNFMRPGPSQRAPVDMCTLVQEVVDLCLPEAARAEVDFCYEPPRDQQIIVSVDAIQIQQVIVNLVQNALQAMEHAPPQRRRLTLGMSVAHQAVQVDVVDGGPGLAHEDPEALFAPFHTTKAEGLGIGLSICRSIIEHHQGTIWARSLAGQGAQFSFVLPLAETHAADAARQPDRVRS